MALIATAGSDIKGFVISLMVTAQLTLKQAGNSPDSLMLDIIRKRDSGQTQAEILPGPWSVSG